MRAIPSALIVVLAAGAPCAETLAQGRSDLPSYPVSLSLGPALKDRAKRFGFGAPEIMRLRGACAVRAQVGLVRGAQAGSAIRLDLVLEDAVPNGPTQAQAARGLKPGATVRPGGLTLTGVATTQYGERPPIRFQSYAAEATADAADPPFNDAEAACAAFAERLAHDDLGPYVNGAPAADGGDFASAPP